MFKHNNNAHIKGWLDITTQVKIANEQLCSQPDHVYTRFKLSAHDFLNDWTACDLFDNYLWQSFHDLRAAVSYMVLCFMYTHESLSLSLLYLHILWRHCFRKENFMVNICLPLHKLAEYAETIGQLDVLIFIYHHTIILEYLFCTNSKKDLKCLENVLLGCCTWHSKNIKEKPFPFQIILFCYACQKFTFFSNIYFQHNVCIFLWSNKIQPFHCKISSIMQKV